MNAFLEQSRHVEIPIYSIPLLSPLYRRKGELRGSKNKVYFLVLNYILKRNMSYVNDTLKILYKELI